MKKNLFTLAAIAAAFLAASCSDPIPVESVTVTPTSKTLTIGETMTVSATVLPEDADDKTLTWTSSDSNVASVDAKGLVTAIASGKATITATSADGAVKGECAITVTLKDALYSFTSRSYLMSASAKVEVNLVNADGSSYVAEEEIVIPVKVNAEGTTAVEGTNFKFNDKKEVVIPVGKNSGSVVLDCVKQEAGKDIVVLDFDVPAEASYLIAGQYVSTKITIFGSYADQLKGTWVMDKLDTDKDFMDGMWGGYLSMEGYPEFNAEDTMTFGDNGLETSFKSNLKNFFKPQSDITLGEEMEVHAGITGFKDIRTVQMLWLSNTNRYFVADQTSTDTESVIGIRINDESKLEVFLFDVEYKGFFKEIIEWGVNPTKPVIGDSSGSYIIFTMKRAN